MSKNKTYHMVIIHEFEDDVFGLDTYDGIHTSYLDKVRSFVSSHGFQGLFPQIQPTDIKSVECLGSWSGKTIISVEELDL